MAIVPVTTTLANLSSIVLGYITTNAGDIFNKDKIVKWAKDKPVNRNALHTLTDDNKRMGRITEGYVWGNLAVTTNYSNIHSRNWDYLDFPTGGIESSPYRIADFIGYDNAAKPTLTGTSGEFEIGEIVYTKEYPFGCLLNWDNYSNNTTGVDPTTAIDGTSIYNLYLCIAIDGYCTAMLNGRANNTVVPIYSSSIQGNYGREYVCPKLPTDLQKTGTHNVSFFLTSDISDINGAWSNLANVQRESAITIPNLVGASISFVQSSTVNTFGEWSLGTIVLNTNTSIMTISAQPTKAPTATHKYKVVVVFNSVGTASSTEVTIESGNSFGSAFNIPNILPIDGGTFTYNAALYGVLNNGSQQILAGSSGSVTYNP